MRCSGGTSTLHTAHTLRRLEIASELVEPPGQVWADLLRGFVLVGFGVVKHNLGGFLIHFDDNLAQADRVSAIPTPFEPRLAGGTHIIVVLHFLSVWWTAANHHLDTLASAGPLCAEQGPV